MRPIASMPVGARQARREIANDQGGGPRHGARRHRSRDPGPRGAGVSQDTFLARGRAQARTLRYSADGPDEVHLESVARLEIGRDGP
jgi:hypothetical protein